MVCFVYANAYSIKKVFIVMNEIQKQKQQNRQKKGKKEKKHFFPKNERNPNIILSFYKKNKNKDKRPNEKRLNSMFSVSLLFSSR